MHMFLAEQGQESWAVVYADYPEEVVQASDPDAMLDGAVAGAASNVGGEVVSKAEIALDGSPGRECTISLVQNGQDMVLRARIFLVGNRLYQIMVIVPKGEENSQEIDSFLQSFQLLGE